MVQSFKCKAMKITKIVSHKPRKPISISISTTRYHTVQINRWNRNGNLISPLKDTSRKFPNEIVCHFDQWSQYKKNHLMLFSFECMSLTPDKEVVRVHNTMKFLRLKLNTESNSNSSKGIWPNQNSFILSTFFLHFIWPHKLICVWVCVRECECAGNLFIEWLCQENFEHTNCDNHIHSHSYTHIWYAYSFIHSFALILTCYNGTP